MAVSNPANNMGLKSLGRSLTANSEVYMDTPILSDELMNCLKKYWRNGFKEAIRIGVGLRKGDVTYADRERYNLVRSKAEELYAKYMGGGDGDTTEKDIMAFREFKKKGYTKKIRSRKLNDDIILCPDERVRSKICAGEHPKETVYTCDEIIFLLKNKYSIEDLTTIHKIMYTIDGALVPNREISFRGKTISMKDIVPEPVASST